jgi:hypothetical protein
MIYNGIVAVESKEQLSPNYLSTNHSYSLMYFFCYLELIAIATTLLTHQLNLRKNLFDCKGFGVCASKRISFGCSFGARDNFVLQHS